MMINEKWIIFMYVKVKYRDIVMKVYDRNLVV